MMTVLTDIERDLRAFADPWSTVIVDDKSAIWERNGVEMTVSFMDPADSGAFPDILLQGDRMSYRDFLAGPQMADLRTLAGFVEKTHRQASPYVETAATLIDDGPTPLGQVGAVDLVRERATEDLPFLSTRVLLVHGEAGSGKTIALREATARQAERFRQGKASCLFFLVDAQGRALSRLEDAMAKDLQDLRARFSYAAVAPLTRHKLLVPIIDGFDELLGSGGYDEAFSSLAAFLATLDGKGSVVASARSAFFNYRNFYDNATRYSSDRLLNYQVETVAIAPWDRRHIELYFDAYCDGTSQPTSDLRQRLARVHETLDPQNQELLSKPFYASRVATLVASGTDVRGDEALLDQLVNAFVEREHGKLLDKDGQPLLTVKGHRAFLSALAEEMWWQEDQRLDVGTVQVVAELITEQFGLPPAASHAIVERVSSYAFLASDAVARRTLRFEHEVFFGYFLAHKLREYIEREPTDLRRFLSRAVLEPTLVEQTVRLLGTDVERCSRAVEAICSVVRPLLAELVARENAGTLVGAILRHAGAVSAGVTVQNVIFQGLGLGPLQASALRFANCEFIDVDFGFVRLTEPAFEGSTLRNVVIDLGTTRMEGLNPAVRDNIHGILVRGEAHGLPSGRVFAPDDVSRVLVAIGMTTPSETLTGSSRSDHAQARIEVLDRFLHKMARRFYISHDDLDRLPFTKKPEWGKVRSLLEKHALLEEHIVSKSGPSIPLVRLAVPPEVLRRGEDPRDMAVPSAVRAYWLELLNN